VKVVEEGPVRSAIEVRRTICQSTFVQRIVLGKQARRLDFETWIDWKENRKLLKVRFYTTIVSRIATYDIAYGNIDRPCYDNNSYDEAKFEVCAHQWMDMSQPDYGLSLLNDCKYGHQAKENMICLTLLKSPKNPDPQSDIETHTFTYSLYPHAHDWRAADTMREAMDLNFPIDTIALDTSKAGGKPDTHTFITIDNPAATLEAVKKAVESSDVIVRVVERHGTLASVSVQLDRNFVSIRECNLVEKEDRLFDGESTGDKFAFTLQPYEIKTFKIAGLLK
jgi:alpha-mannosidase